jgi:hypothetical protein
MDLDFCELFSPLDFFGQGGTLGRASAKWLLVGDSPVGFTGRIHRSGIQQFQGFTSWIQQSDSPVRPARRIGGLPEGGHLRIWRAAPDRAH